MLHLKKKDNSHELIFVCVSNCIHSHKTNRGPDLHSLSAGAHVFAEHDVVEGGRTDQEEHLLDGLVDEPRLHAMLAHDGVEDTELLDD